LEVEGIPFSTDALQIGGELTDCVQPYALCTAVNGVTGFRGFMLQTIADAARRPIKLFGDRSSALEWLIIGDDSEQPGWLDSNQRSSAREAVLPDSTMRQRRRRGIT